MYTRFVYRGDDTITGSNFDIDLTHMGPLDHKRKSASISASCGPTGYAIPIMA